MISQQLLDYIKQQTQQGVSKEQIESLLIINSWQAKDVDDAFSFLLNQASQLSSVPLPIQTSSIFSLPGATAIFGQAWTIYKQRFGIFLGIMAMPMLIGVLLFGVPAAGGINLPSLLAILFFVIIFISQAWGQTALLYAIKDSQEKIGVVESYQRGWHKILSYWWVSLLAGFIITSGFFLLIVPGIIFATWFSLAVFILIAEDIKGINAVLKSREYVRGKWGSVFWRFFFIVIISSIIYLVPIFIFNFLKIPFGLGISRFVIGLFLTPLVMTYSFLVYHNLKALKGDIAFTPNGSKKAIFIFVGILGILAIPVILFSVAFFSFGAAKGKALDARRRSDVGQIQTELEIFYTEQNKYPFSLNELSRKRLPTTPVDPITRQPYQYQLQKNGTDYTVCTQLENTKEQKCVTSQSRL